MVEDQAFTTNSKELLLKLVDIVAKTIMMKKDHFRIKPCGICGKNGHSENNCFSKKNSANMVEDTSDEKAYMVDDKDFCF